MQNYIAFREKHSTFFHGNESNKRAIPANELFVRYPNEAVRTVTSPAFKNTLSLDLSYYRNKLLINEIADLDDNWDEYDSPRIPTECIKLARSIIDNVSVQPIISPTGRRTIYMQYELSDSSFLGFEVGLNSVKMLFVHKQDYDNAQQEVITSNIVEIVKAKVVCFYESRIY